MLTILFLLIRRTIATIHGYVKGGSSDHCNVSHPIGDRCCRRVE